MDKQKFEETFTDTRGNEYLAYRLDRLDSVDVSSLPYSIRVLLESCIRKHDGDKVRDEHVEALANYDASDVGSQEFPYYPARVVLQDFTGVPAVVDLAALRTALERWDGNPEKVNPMIRSDLVIDHSVQVDEFRGRGAYQINTEKEFERNKERYEFLKWGKQAFDNFSVVPPETGIIHQVNLEYFASSVMTREVDGQTVAYPDTLVGTDSHTTMINGLGVLGWGVGGIEAEACMLGEPIAMLIPEVVGFELTGELVEGATATDLVLTVTEMLREHGVVGKFVEFYGEGLEALSLADRATIANMAPEYGATTGFFPIDDRTLEYLYLTGRSEEQIDLVESYAKFNSLWRNDDEDIEYSSSLKLDLGEVNPSLAGPMHPQDRINLAEMQADFNHHLRETFEKPEKSEGVQVEYDGKTFEFTDGDLAIAAITSCTNTSNPSVMIGAGLVAKKANELGLKAKPWVKTSLAPGSRVVTEYLDEAGLTEQLEDVGFYTVGYGCTTCIGNSGPLPEPIHDAIQQEDLVAASILSGNRNFEGRVSPDTKANYLASPPLVVAYALAGTVDIDIYNDPIAETDEGDPIYLQDIWPSKDEIREVRQACVSRQQFVDKYSEVYDGPEKWNELSAPTGKVYEWRDDSTYIQEPPFFQNLPREPEPITSIEGARCLVAVGNQTTTDHISPAGAIPTESAAGRYLQSLGVSPKEFNSYGSRRGNDQVMTRGTFANIRLENHLADGKEGGFTRYLGPEERADERPDDLTYETDVDPEPGEICYIYDAAVKYMEHQIPLVVFAGTDYGMGSSRDWAAKGTRLLGVEVVVATSYERIHRSNLIGMGVLPLQFEEADSYQSIGLSGTEIFDVHVPSDLEPGQTITITATDPETSQSFEFPTKCRLDSEMELEYYRHGGILEMVLRGMG
jgi:aconitate hydratase